MGCGLVIRYGSLYVLWMQIFGIFKTASVNQRICDCLHKTMFSPEHNEIKDLWINSDGVVSLLNVNDLQSLIRHLTYLAYWANIYNCIVNILI